MSFIPPYDPADKFLGRRLHSRVGRFDLYGYILSSRMFSPTTSTGIVSTHYVQYLIEFQDETLVFFREEQLSARLAHYLEFFSNYKSNALALLNQLIVRSFAPVDGVRGSYTGSVVSV